MALTNDDLSIKLYFDLDNDRFRIEDITDYAGAGVATSDVVGVYSYTDPNDNILHENIDFNDPDIDVDSSLYSAYVDFVAVDGDQTIVYSVYDSNADATYTKTFIITYDSDVIPDVVIGVESNVALATIESTDETAYTDDITLNTRTHILTYPASWGSTTSTSTTVNSISLTELYTGNYGVTVESNITIEVDTDFQIDITINGSQDHSVWDSDGMYAVRAALDTFYDRWIAAQTSNPKLARQYAETWNQINSNYAMFNSHKQNGDVANAGEYMNNIKELLSAEGIDTTIDPSVSVPVSATLPGYASQWLSGSGVPSESIGRVIDFYYRTDTSQVYSKATGDWVLESTLGANTIIQFSANGSTGWTTTYANGLNYIRFSGDNGLTWTVASKFIDGYRYVAYASDDSGSDFICDDDPSFTFNPLLEYRAEKKFDESHNGDLIASDFTGLFRKLADNGYSFSINPGTILVVTDADGNNAEYSDVSSEIRIYKGDTDFTDEFVFTKGSVSNADGSLTDNVLTVSSITSDAGYINVVCTKAGVTTFTVKIYVKKAKKGQAVIDITSIDNITIGLTGGNKIEVKDRSIGTDQLNLNFMNDLIPMTENSVAQSLTYPSFVYNKLNYNQILFRGNPLFSVGTLNLSTKAWSLVDTAVSYLTDTRFDYIENNKVVTYSFGSADQRLRMMSFNGVSSFSTIGNSLLISKTVYSICKLSSSTVAISIDYAPDGGNLIQAYQFDGTNWSTLGSLYNTTTDNCVLKYLEDNVVLRYDTSSNEFSILTYSTGSGTWSESGLTSVSGGYVSFDSSKTGIAVLDSNNFLILSTARTSAKHYKKINNVWVLYNTVYGFSTGEFNFTDLTRGFIGMGANGYVIGYKMLKFVE